MTPLKRIDESAGRKLVLVKTTNLMAEKKAFELQQVIRGSATAIEKLKPICAEAEKNLAGIAAKYKTTYNLTRLLLDTFPQASLHVSNFIYIKIRSLGTDFIVKIHPFAFFDEYYKEPNAKEKAITLASSLVEFLSDPLNIERLQAEHGANSIKINLNGNITFGHDEGASGLGYEFIDVVSGKEISSNFVPQSKALLFGLKTKTEESEIKIEQLISDAREKAEKLLNKTRPAKIVIKGQELCSPSSNFLTLDTPLVRQIAPLIYAYHSRVIKGTVRFFEVPHANGWVDEIERPTFFDLPVGDQYEGQTAFITYYMGSGLLPVRAYIHDEGGNLIAALVGKKPRDTDDRSTSVHMHKIIPAPTNAEAIRFEELNGKPCRPNLIGSDGAVLFPVSLVQEDQVYVPFIGHLDLAKKLADGEIGKDDLVFIESEYWFNYPQENKKEIRLALEGEQKRLELIPVRLPAAHQTMMDCLRMVGKEWHKAMFFKVFGPTGKILIDSMFIAVVKPMTKAGYDEINTGYLGLPPGDGIDNVREEINEDIASGIVYQARFEIRREIFKELLPRRASLIKAENDQYCLLLHNGKEYIICSLSKSGSEEIEVSLPRLTDESRKDAMMIIKGLTQLPFRAEILGALAAA